MAERFLVEARNRTIAVEHGRIAEPHGRYDLVLRFSDADLRPGLINAHDHLHRNHYGRLGDPPYADAYEWVADVRLRHGAQVAAGKAMPRRDMLLRGAWKNLLAGVTTVIHHDTWEPEFDHGFPLRVARVQWANSLGVPPGVEDIDPRRPYCIHLAEGRSPRAAEEVRQLDALGLLGPNLVAVHGCAMDEDAVRRFRASGAALVWCPSSNRFLFRRTAPSELLTDGVDVLLGSDSLLTGEGDLLHELRIARDTGFVSDERLEHAVGRTAARRLGLAEARLEPGERADLVVLSHPLLEASAADVELVVAGGVIRVARRPYGPNACPMTRSGITRWIDSGARRETPRECAIGLNRTANAAPLPAEGLG